MTVPPDEAVSIAIRLHREGRLVEAQMIYEGVLKVRPRHADALHFLGVAYAQLGRRAEAQERIRAALDAAPEYADAHLSLGNVLKLEGDVHGAEASYRRALELTPVSATAMSNLAVVLKVQGRLDEAVELLRSAVEISPEHAAAQHNLGNLLRRMGRYAEAAEAFAKTVKLRPGDALAYRNLGYSLYRAGQPERATAVIADALTRDPDNVVLAHLHAAFSGSTPPPRASDDFVRGLFDEFAATFDENLGELNYQAPDLVASAIAGAAGPAQGALDVLDAGCGTGLCGPLVKPFARRLDGVDLSPGMLDRAKERGVYDELHVSELTGWLASRRDAYDLVVSADTLVYFGDLGAVFGAAASALRRPGILVFTVEEDVSAHERGYRLMPHGRYVHAEAYVRRTAGAAGFGQVSIERVVLRLEGGEPVAGLLVTARATVWAVGDGCIV